MASKKTETSVTQDTEIEQISRYSNKNTQNDLKIARDLVYKFYSSKLGEVKRISDGDLPETFPEGTVEEMKKLIWDFHRSKSWFSDKIKKGKAVAMRANGENVFEKADPKSKIWLTKADMDEVKAEKKKTEEKSEDSSDKDKIKDESADDPAEVQSEDQVSDAVESTEQEQYNKQEVQAEKASSKAIQDFEGSKKTVSDDGKKAGKTTEKEVDKDDIQKVAPYPKLVEKEKQEEKRTPVASQQLKGQTRTQGKKGGKNQEDTPTPPAKITAPLFGNRESKTEDNKVAHGYKNTDNLLLEAKQRNRKEADKREVLSFSEVLQKDISGVTRHPEIKAGLRRAIGKVAIKTEIVKSIDINEDEESIATILGRLPKFATGLDVIKFTASLAREGRDEREKKKSTDRKNTGDATFTKKWLDLLIPDGDPSAAYYDYCDLLPGSNIGTFQQRCCVLLNQYKMKETKLVYQAEYGGKAKVAMTEAEASEAVLTQIKQLRSEGSKINHYKADIETILFEMIKSNKTVTVQFFQHYINEKSKTIEDFIRNPTNEELLRAFINKPGVSFLLPNEVMKALKVSRFFYSPVWEVLLWSGASSFEIKESYSHLESRIQSDASFARALKFNVDNFKYESLTLSRSFKQKPIVGAFTNYIRKICSDLRNIKEGKKTTYIGYKSPLSKKARSS